MKDKKVLIIDDDPLILDITKRVFQKEGALALIANGPHEGLRMCYKNHPDLVILDIMMHEMDGWEVCRQIRLLSEVPIIMLTSLSNDEDIIRGLDYGADDFISKPFNPKVLISRSRAVLRRHTSPDYDEETKKIRYSDAHLTIDFEKMKVFVQGAPIKLTRTEYNILAYMVRNADRVLTFEQILNSVWGWEYRDSVDYIHVYVSHLRRKLEKNPKNPQYIITEHGVGYRFVMLEN